MTQPSKNDSLFEDVDDKHSHVDTSDTHENANDSLFSTDDTTPAIDAKEEEKYKREKQRESNILRGAELGTAVAGGIEVGKQIYPFAQNVLRNIQGQSSETQRELARHAAQSTAGLQKYLNSQLPSDVRLTLDELGKIYGKPINTMSQAQDAIAYIKGAPREAKTVSVDPRTKMPRKVFSAPRPPVDLTQYKYTPTFVTKAADELRYASDVAKGALPTLGRIGIGTAGGALAGAQLYDALNKYAQEGQGLHLPSPRTAAQLASGVGGTLGMLPFGVTQGVGMALQAPELAYQGYEGLKELNERRKQATREDVDRMLMSVDPMGNPIEQPLNTVAAPMPQAVAETKNRHMDQEFEERYKGFWWPYYCRFFSFWSHSWCRFGT